MDEEALNEVGLGDTDYRQLILDFLWAVRSELRIISQGQFHRREDYLLAVGQGDLDFKQMKEDLDSILRGDKTVEDVCTKENIRNNILRRDDFHLEWNTDTLFDVLPKFYRREVKRHQESGRYAIEKAVKESPCHVTQTLAAEFRGCDEKTIWRMKKDEHLKDFLCKHGKPSVEFLIRERGTKKVSSQK